MQQDFVPGLDLSIHFTATKIGRYEIVCTQLCGLGHYNMKAYLSVYSQEILTNGYETSSTAVGGSYEVEILKQVNSGLRFILCTT